MGRINNEPWIEVAAEDADGIRVEIKHRVKAREASSESELIRRALVEYFEHHPPGQAADIDIAAS